MDQINPSVNNYQPTRAKSPLGMDGAFTCVDSLLIAVCVCVCVCVCVWAVQDSVFAYFSLVKPHQNSTSFESYIL